MRKLAVVLMVVTITVIACTPSAMGQTNKHHLHKQQPRSEVVAFMQFALAVHNNPFLACTRGHESDTAGGYQAYNPGGPYYGAYQFLQSTWNTTVLHFGWPQFSGVNILTVPGFIQDLVALGLYIWQGKAPWSYRC